MPADNEGLIGVNDADAHVTAHPNTAISFDTFTQYLAGSKPAKESDFKRVSCYSSLPVILNIAGLCICLKCQSMGCCWTSMK